jgi:hypothetical protein
VLKVVGEENALSALIYGSFSVPIRKKYANEMMNLAK